MQVQISLLPRVIYNYIKGVVEGKGLRDEVLLFSEQSTGLSVTSQLMWLCDDNPWLMYGRGTRRGVGRGRRCRDGEES